MNKVLKEKLIKIKTKHDELNKKLLDKKVFSNLNEYKKISKEIFFFKKVVIFFNEWLKISGEIKELKEISNNEIELKVEIKKEINKSEILLKNLEEKIEKEFELKNKVEDQNTIVEIRSAAGGVEAELFAFEMSEAYFRMLKKLKINFEILTKNGLDSGGYSLISFLVKDKKIYNKLQFESGVHRVQRIPKTETKGRIHTSTITVAVLKEKTETEILISSEDIRIDTFRSSGAGGQHVNTTNSAIRITHLKTGLVVSCQDGRSQHDNKDKAMKVLRSRLFDFFESKTNKDFSEVRSKQIGTGIRSEKIRTYNFPQNRVTDHRINFSYKNIEKVMQGNFEPFWERLFEWQKENKFKNED